MSSQRSLAGLLMVAFLTGCSSDPGPKIPASRAETAKPAAPAKIVMFYASPGVVEAGSSTTMCYGVEDATAVRLEPPIESITPSANRCIQVKPESSRKYTLFATGAAGEVSQSLALRVVPKAARAAAAPSEDRMIETFQASTEQVQSGQQVTICYAVRGATSIRIEPPIGLLSGSDRTCTTVRPTETVTYTLIVSGGGKSDRERLTIHVK